MFLAFQESLSENSLKVLFDKANSLDNCEIAPEKMVNPASFPTVSFSTKNTDKKCQKWLLALSTYQPSYQLFCKYTAGLKNLKRQISFK